tara:strand:- start:508 stop:867 length:360 start_codon:yes stop_codon:yes gene_type:complete
LVAALLGGFLLAGCVTTPEPSDDCIAVGAYLDNVIEANPAVSKIELGADQVATVGKNYNAIPPVTDILLDRVIVFVHPGSRNVLLVISAGGCVQFAQEIPGDFLRRLMSDDSDNSSDNY